MREGQKLLPQTWVLIDEYDAGEVRPFGELMYGNDETTWVKYL